MCPQNLLWTSYRVEISGWDSDANFFVENTELEWNEDQGKKVSLRRRLRDGALVFVRLVGPTTGGQNYPTAYEVQNLSAADSAGRGEVRLVQLQPRFANHAARS